MDHFLNQFIPKLSHRLETARHHGCTGGTGNQRQRDEAHGHEHEQGRIREGELHSSDFRKMEEFLDLELMDRIDALRHFVPLCPVFGAVISRFSSRFLRRAWPFGLPAPCS
jgi:hypothetical protein